MPNCVRSLSFPPAASSFYCWSMALCFCWPLHYVSICIREVLVAISNYSRVPANIPSQALGHCHSRANMPFSRLLPAECGLVPLARRSENSCNGTIKSASDALSFQLAGFSQRKKHFTYFFCILVVSLEDFFINIVLFFNTVYSYINIIVWDFRFSLLINLACQIDFTFNFVP